jgi:hypothetical protein
MFHYVLVVNFYKLLIAQERNVTQKLQAYYRIMFFASVCAITQITWDVYNFQSLQIFEVLCHLNHPHKPLCYGRPNRHI